MPVFAIAKISLKHNALLSVLVAASIILITPVLFGTVNLDRLASAAPLEMFVSLIGIVLLTPVFQPEQNKEIRDLVASKYVSPIPIYAIRTLYAAIIAAVFIGVFGVYMRGQECDVTPLLLIGTAANAIFLGSLGMMTASLTDNTVTGYMTPMVFYALNYGMGSQWGPLYLFSMSQGDFESKQWLLIIGAVLIGASLAVKWLKQKLA